MSRFSLHRAVVLTVLASQLAAALPARAQEGEKKTLFLPKSPVAAAYVLARLSNKELAEAPRSEFVYVALLQRAGLDRKYRLEALDGLAKARGTDSLVELIRGISELEKKGEEVLPVLRELSALLLQRNAAELGGKRADLTTLTTEAQQPFARQTAYAALITAEGAVEPVWKSVESDAAKLADVLRAIPQVRAAGVRAAAYTNLKPLLEKSDAEDLRRAAIAAIASVPGKETEVFTSLAALGASGTERAAVVSALQHIPRNLWPKDQAAPLLASLMTYLKAVPADQRTGTEAVEAYQLASDLVPLLSPDAAKVAGKELRAVGVSVFVIRTIHEQMIYDKLQLVVEAGKPVEIVLINEDAMPHNLVVVTPGAAEEVGKAAEKMMPDPDAQGRIHVPASPKVLHATKMLNGGQQAKLSFTAPADPGEYQYICTFPGHWMRMLGKLIVVPDVEAYLAAQPAAVEPKTTEWKPADLAADLTKVGTSRNLAGGRETFGKLACVQCHKIGTEGYAYGPDLTEVMKRLKNDRAALLTEILEPSKVIADRYKIHVLELNDGDEVTGMVMKEDAESVTLQTGPSDALVQTLKKSAIKKGTVQVSSIMPVGLLNQLSKDQILDLLSYVESGGAAGHHQH